MGVRIARDEEFVGDKVEDEGDEEGCEDEVAWNVSPGQNRPLVTYRERGRGREARGGERERGKERENGTERERGRGYRERERGRGTYGRQTVR